MVEEVFNDVMISNDVVRICICIMYDWMLVMLECGLISVEVVFVVIFSGVFGYYIMVK